MGICVGLSGVRALVAGAALWSLSGCFAGGTMVDTPLYPVGAQPLPPEEVARLVGYVQQVDGEDVSQRGSAFALLPGCHMVVTPTQWSRGTANSGATMVNTGPILFALPMKAGRQYVVDVQIEASSGPKGRVTIATVEKDLQGNVTGTFAPARSDADLAKCRAV
jgi:hypothetical protein